MDPDEIELQSINKLFEYEKHVRIIDQLNVEELKRLQNFTANYTCSSKKFFLL